ncbi:MAG TPA: hypothetical protein VL691_09690 [Vicinamibacteria bacterium]|nr:hypothetical protein [Vicinamibacteria bacterium]
MSRRAFWTVACVAFSVALALPATADDVNVSGKWKMTSKSPRGERVSEITLDQKGEKLVVTSKDREGNDVKSDGTVKGADIAWTTKRTGPMGEMVISYKGKVDGKAMSGTVEFGQMGSGEWKAEKVE